MGYPAGELLVLGWELYAIHQQFWDHLKVQKIMDQHNFEMIHFKCTIPASNTMYHSCFTVLCRPMV